MTGDKLTWTVRARVSVDRGGAKVLGRGRVELLRHIDHHHSIAAAAKQMGMSYRRAWSLVRDINRAAGEPLVEVTAGGPGGGGAALTARGRAALALYDRAVARIDRATAGLKFRTPSA
ncbi:MAG: winged helix-turn-helix domain-containing protein [Gemmataceae bacterium]